MRKCILFENLLNYLGYVPWIPPPKKIEPDYMAILRVLEHKVRDHGQDCTAELSKMKQIRETEGNDPEVQAYFAGNPAIVALLDHHFGQAGLPELMDIDTNNNPV